MNFQFLSKYPEGDWPEDFPHENGNYMCSCTTCGKTFIGHKRRHTCKKCDRAFTERWNALTPEEQKAETEANARLIRAIFNAPEKPTSPQAP